MSVLVTGGGLIGFVGDWCTNSDEPVLNLDNLPCAGNLDNLACLQGTPATPLCMTI